MDMLCYIQTVDKNILELRILFDLEIRLPNVSVCNYYSLVLLKLKALTESCNFTTTDDLAFRVKNDVNGAIVL